MSEQTVEVLRDDKGRFLPGTKPGPGGDKKAAIVNQLRAAALAAIKPEVMAGIMLKMAELALKGNVRAAEFVANRVLGKCDVAMRAVQEVMGDGSERRSIEVSGLDEEDVAMAIDLLRRTRERVE